MTIDECHSIEDVRTHIDRIDAGIVRLIAERSLYVKEASRLKKNENGVKAPDRVEKVINKVKTLAASHGLDEGIIENVYRTMISGFINMEITEFKKREKG
jgi:isochorismate pyruvate lyase